MRVVPYHRESTTLLDVQQVSIDNCVFDVEQVRQVEGGFLVVLKGVENRERANMLRGGVVSVDRTRIPLEEGEYLLADLVGCRVYLPDQSFYGIVVRIELGPQDRLVIHNDGMERLLPCVDEFLHSVDVVNKQIVIDPPEGLSEVPIGLGE